MTIDTLISDVQQLLKRKDGWFNEDLSKSFAADVSQRLSESFNSKDKPATLRLSQMGPKCPRALWHSIHTPELAEPLPPWAEMKFAFGHIIESWAITLAKAAGHKVEGEQDELYVDGIKGHRDCVIDGCVVDVKSCSSRAFTKFKDKSLGQNDSFGYLDQLDGYLVASAEDPLVTNKSTGYLWAIDKQLGHMCLYEHESRPEHIRSRIKDYKTVVALRETPKCTCRTEPDGESGNVKLGVPASYSDFKYTCFPSLRTFLYSGGPRYLTHVERRPYDNKAKRYITEVDKQGRVVYN